MPIQLADDDTLISNLSIDEVTEMLPSEGSKVQISKLNNYYKNYFLHIIHMPIINNILMF